MNGQTDGCTKRMRLTDKWTEIEEQIDRRADSQRGKQVGV